MTFCWDLREYRMDSCAGVMLTEALLMANTRYVSRYFGLHRWLMQTFFIFCHPVRYNEI